MALETVELDVNQFTVPKKAFDRTHVGQSTMAGVVVANMMI